MDFFNSKYILSNKRHGWIDYDRGISIILVTYRHCFDNMKHSGLNMNAYPWLEYINIFLFGFRMPLFFIASGIFLSGSLAKNGLNGYAKNRAQSILYPMIVWGFIQISLQIIFSKYTNSGDVIGIQSYWHLFVKPRATGQFWYLNALFCVGIIYASLKEFLKFKLTSQIILGLLLYILCGYVNEKGIEIGFLNDILKYYLFFALGDMISNYMRDDKAIRFFTAPQTLLLLTAVFAVNQYFFTKINLASGNNYQVENHMPAFFLLVALVGCALSVSVSFTLKKLKALEFLRVTGYNSVHIYCMQIIVMTVFRRIFINLLQIHNIPLLSLLILTAGIIVPMVIYNICLRLNLWWLFTLKKPEDEIRFLNLKKVL